MTKAYTVTIDLEDDDAAYAESCIAEGTYPDIGALAANAISELRDRDDGEDLTKDQIASAKSAYQNIRSNPASGVPLSKAREQLLKRHNERQQSKT